ncbi:MAG: ribonuclease catalytic domain-containing protein, partial [Cyanobacteria bacterium P01_D01_bin.73]
MQYPFLVEEIQAARSLKTDALLQERPAAQGITIDGETSMDLDDAFWVVPQGDGAIAYLYVADPTAAIAQDSVLDTMVRRRITSRYFPWGVEPMLPTDLSHGSLSLLPGQARPALELAIALDSKAAVQSVGWRFVRFSNLRQLSYAKADRVLDRPEDPLFTQLSYGQIWAKKLAVRRRDQGAIGAMVVGGVYYDEEGRASTQPLRSQMLIAELAILANVTVANLLRESGYPAMYRNHGARRWAGSTAELVAKLTTGDPDEAEALRNELSHDLGKAQYAATAEGHFALAESAYCHSTSPLRRLTDFINHRVLHAIAQKQPPPYSA